MAEHRAGEEQRRSSRFVLSEHELEQIAEQIAERVAERAAEKALENFYFEVGKVTIRAAMYIIGAGVLALGAWLGVAEKIRN